MSYQFLDYGDDPPVIVREGPRVIAGRDDWAGLGMGLAIGVYHLLCGLTALVVWGGVVVRLLTGKRAR